MNLLSEWIGAVIEPAQLGPLINFKITFLSIIIESLPFLILSVVVSSLLQNLVNEETIYKILPRNKAYGILPACFLGILLPVCDCGTVPIARSLVAKGIPLYVAVPFMLAAPIINPVTILATNYAFTPHIQMVYLRLAMALCIACLTGLIIKLLFGEQKELSLHSHLAYQECSCTTTATTPSTTTFLKLRNTLYGTCDEFFSMGKYLIIGALLGSLVQNFLPRAALVGVGQSHLLSTLSMILFGYTISVCSSADAFIAASFATAFTSGSLIAFMVFGPMIDVKNTLMLLAAFRFRFVAMLILIITLLCTAGGLLINLVSGGVLL
jgi:uncharacterized membrane protein YraQ (UPF0718 family)